jgi:tetratricopeptide (TPR) repeat protein
MKARFGVWLLLALVSPLALRAQGARESTPTDSAIALLSTLPVGSAAHEFDRPIALLDRALAATPGDGVALHYKGYALYRKASALANDRSSKKEFKSLLQQADRTLDESAAAIEWPETVALRSAVIGQLIPLSGMLAVVRLGPRSNGLMDRAMKLGPDNPRVWLLRGISAVYKPSQFGGGLGNAERDLKKAIELFDGDAPAAQHPAWGYAEAWAWLGRVYADQKRVDEARAAYAKALEIAPELPWVSKELIPALMAQGR